MADANKRSGGIDPNIASVHCLWLEPSLGRVI